jgi:hypothetical protein
MKAFALTLLACLVVAFASPAFATTYYVATTGLDTNPGTSAQPWATLQHAVVTIAAGDTILVMPGTYAGARIETSGAAGAYKTLSAQTVGTVTLNSLSASARHSGIIEVENYSASVNYWVINGFICDGNNGLYRPIDVRSTDAQKNSHITVTNNMAFGALSTGIACGHTDYLDVEHNTSHNNPNEHGTYMNNSSDFGIIRYTLSYSNGGCCMHFNGDRKTGGGDGIMSGWLIEKNVGYSCLGGAAINMDGVSTSSILNNLLYANVGTGMTFFATDASQASSNDIVYNNTICTPSTGRNTVLINTGAVGDVFKNNILWNDNATKCSICTYGSAVSGFASDYNVVTDRFSVNNAKKTINLATWRTYGYDTHSVLLTSPSALFVSYGSNFHLAAGSPAIGAGTTLTQVTDDLDGYARTAPYSIGCYQYH